MVDPETHNKKKKLNALRRCYQRTRATELRENPKKIYHDEKSRYQAAIKGKSKFVEEYFNLTTSSNPWNTVYKLATNKHKRSLSMKTLLKPDGSYTSNLNENVQVMPDHLITIDDQTDSTDYHKRIRI